MRANDFNSSLNSFVKVIVMTSLFIRKQTQSKQTSTTLPPGSLDFVLDCGKINLLQQSSISCRYVSVHIGVFFEKNLSSRFIFLSCSFINYVTSSFECVKKWELIQRILISIENETFYFPEACLSKYYFHNDKVDNGFSYSYCGVLVFTYIKFLPTDGEFLLRVERVLIPCIWHISKFRPWDISCHWAIGKLTLFKWRKTIITMTVFQWPTQTKICIIHSTINEQVSASNTCLMIWIIKLLLSIDRKAHFIQHDSNWSKNSNNVWHTRNIAYQYVRLITKSTVKLYFVNVVYLKVWTL